MEVKVKCKAIITNYGNKLALIERDYRDCKEYAPTLPLQDIRNIVLIQNQYLNLSKEVLLDKLIQIRIDTPAPEWMNS